MAHLTKAKVVARLTKAKVVALAVALISHVAMPITQPALAGEPSRHSDAKLDVSHIDDCCTTATSKSPKKVNVNAKTFQVTGEVVDTWCFASKAVLGGRGPEHYKCADACAHGGVTLGIVDDKGTLYIAAKTKAYNGCQHLLEPYVAKRIVATGWLSQAGGCNIMKIDKVELAKDKPQPKLP